MGVEGVFAGIHKARPVVGVGAVSTEIPFFGGVVFEVPDSGEVGGVSEDAVVAGSLVNEGHAAIEELVGDIDVVDVVAIVVSYFVAEGVARDFPEPDEFGGEG